MLRSQAVEAGLSQDAIDRLVASGRLEVLHPGVYLPAGTSPTFYTRLTAACLKGGPEAVASHRGAAALWELEGCSSVIEISSPRRIQLAGATVHRTTRLEPRDKTRVKGIPVTAIDRTLIDLGAVVPTSVLESALESAVRLGLTIPRRIEERLEAHRGRRGTAVLRGLLDCRDPDVPPPSWLEREFKALLIEYGLRGWTREFPVFGGKRRIDYAWPHLMLGIEVHGGEWHLRTGRWADTWAKHNELTAAGWTMLHFTWLQFRDNATAVAGEIGRTATRLRLC